VSEIIVVDDGSHEPLCLDKMDGLEKIKYLRKPNGGVSSARNYGIRKAKSEYIAFIDADDLWAPKKIPKQINYLKKHKTLNWCFCNYKTEFDRFSQLPRKADRELKEKGFFDSYIDIALWGVPHQTSGFVAKKELLITAGLYDESLNAAEDLDLYFRIAALDSRVGYLDDILYTYQVGIPNSQAKSPDRASDAIQSLIKLSERFNNSSQSLSFNRKAFNRYAENSVFRALLHYYDGFQNLTEQTEKESLDLLRENKLLYTTIRVYRQIPTKIREKLGGRLRDMNRQLLYRIHT
jgi:glycosyltransferase involved in cell wall biosynthesis